jgi:hypothetical protein
MPPRGQPPVRPSAARVDLIVEHLADESLVYDPVAGRAHCLSRVARDVLASCDGHRAARAIATLVGVELALVEHALSELACSDLLRAPSRMDRGRRRVVSQLVLTAGLSIAAPMIWSIVAPSTAQAASTVMCTACGMGTVNMCCNTGLLGAGTCTKVTILGGTSFQCVLGGPMCGGKACQ